MKYKVEMVKEGKRFWHVLETPTKNVVGKYFFEEDANQLADFQNKQLGKRTEAYLNFFGITSCQMLLNSVRRGIITGHLKELKVTEKILQI